MSSHSACIGCLHQNCFRGDLENMPKGCPTRTHPELARDAGIYLTHERRELMRIADEVPFDPKGMKRSRVQELIAFACGRGYQRVGVAFCVTMTEEAQALGVLLRQHGLSPELVCCRVGAVDRTEVELPKTHPERYSSTCNPVAQARLLNNQAVELVVQMGLCIGHDLILQEESQAPVTTLVVKDRVHDHQPILALRKPIAL